MAAALVGLVLASCAPTTLPAGQAAVLRVVDGDTITVRFADEDVTVRLLGIDTPETVHPHRPVECFGPEASDHLGALLAPGTIVVLERDTDLFDPFGRLLAYVHRAEDGLHANLAMVQGGYAEVLVIGANRARAAELRAAESEARAAGRGLWGACG